MTAEIQAALDAVNATDEFGGIVQLAAGKYESDSTQPGFAPGFESTGRYSRRRPAKRSVKAQAGGGASDVRDLPRAQPGGSARDGPLR